jgi:hypothetical protein
MIMAKLGAKCVSSLTDLILQKLLRVKQIEDNKGKHSFLKESMLIIKT